jgi:hypothetical protein
MNKFFQVILIGVLLLEPVVGQRRSKFHTSEKASYYHDKFEGKSTSNGETYDGSDFTAAHRTLPFNSIILVTNKLNHRTVVVRINDRGPFQKSRTIDLSRSAAVNLEMIPFGVVPVKITPLKMLDKLAWKDTTFHAGENWDVYGNKTTPSELTIGLWATSDWRHAFYMGSNLSMEEVKKTFLIHVVKNGDELRFLLCQTAIKDSSTIKDLLNDYRHRGFQGAGPADFLSSSPTR